MSEKLKQCPFCGSKNIHLIKVMSTYSVDCGDCEATTGEMFDEAEEKAKLKAITHWNRRAKPWHTGTPTEEGDYLVKLDVEHHVYPYYVLKWANGWYSHYDMDNLACPKHSVLKWQKIEQ